MTWHISFGWELSSYIILLFLLWIIIRYFASHALDALHAYINSNDNSSGYFDGVVDPWFNNVNFPVSYWIEKGKRNYQEDRHCQMKGIGEPDSSLYSVFDGHAGYRAAQYCKDNLLVSLLADVEFVKNPPLAMRKTFHK